MTLAKASIEIAREYLALVDDDRLWEPIADEHARTVAAVLEIVEADELLDRHPVVQRSIRLRNPYVDPMNAIQVELLRALPKRRRCGRAAAPALDRRHRRRPAEHGMRDAGRARGGARPHAAVAQLTDDGVTRALERAAALVDERHDAIAAANAEDVARRDARRGRARPAPARRRAHRRARRAARRARGAAAARARRGRVGARERPARLGRAASRSARSARTSRRGRTSPSTSPGSC